MKFSIQKTKTTTTTMTLEQIKKNVSGNGSRKKDAMQILAQIIRLNRVGVLHTHAGYKIITNGYGEFKCVDVAWPWEPIQRVPAQIIFHRIAQLERILYNDCVVVQDNTGNGTYRGGIHETTIQKH